MASLDGGLEAYIDEEQALGFHVWVAELELLVGTAKGRSVDQVAAFELLQKVLVTIDTTDVGRVREYQRRCELALLDILLKGAAPPVRRLICECMARLYTVGDTLPLYSRASGLVTLLSGKDARGLASPVRLGALQCLATLCEKHGRPLASSMSETLAVALKHAARGIEPAVRTAALELVAKVVAGLGGYDRSSAQVQLDALKCAIRAAKDAADSSGRLAAASIIRAIAQAGGTALWSNLSWYEEAAKLCTGLLEAEDRATADAFAGVLGTMAAASRSEAAANVVKAWEKKPSRQAAVRQAIKQATKTLLVGPFVDAAAHTRWQACKALTQSWLAYLTHVQEAGEGDGELVGLAATALEMLAEVSARAPSPPLTEEGEPELGAALSSGEVPPAQACVVYLVRVGIIERLGETGQRAMLERLGAMLESEASSRPPLAAATLESAALLLDVLGEISPEQVAALEQPVAAKLIAASSCVRRQAAGLLAAMATAEPASAARLLRQRLQALADAATQAAGLLRTEPKITSQEVELGGSPKGLFRVEAAELKPCLDAVHGNALGAAALLVAAARLPLGLPSKLLLEALALAERLIGTPASKRAAGQAAERQAGYILLGALPLSLPPDRLVAERQRLVQLWQPALAAESAAELDLRKYLTISQAKAEVTMSMELWWRATALEALKALILSPLVSAATPDATRLQRRLAAILQPTLAVVLASPLLQDPQRAKGVLSGACAVFQLRLLEAYLALPSPAAFAAEHQALSRLCSRAFRGSAAQPNSAPDAAAAAAGGTLRMLLNRQDAPLGPWVAGRGPLEDALQAFAGTPGGPPRLPWQAGLSPSASYPDAGEDVEQQEPFTQPRSLSAALLERQLVLLGGLLASVSETNQLLILDVLTAASTAPPPKRGVRDSPGRRRAVLTALCCAALAGLDSLARRYRGEAGARDAVAERARVLAEAALEEGVSLGDAALLRAAAEMFALAACIGSDSHAVQLLRHLCTSMEAAPAPARRACLALALGCIYRSKGGIALQASVGRTAGSLLAVARSSSGTTLAWLLHALWLLANAAGLALLPHVQEVLALEMELVMSEEAATLPGMRPTLARLANALVAVLGPELTPGSTAYSRTRCLLLDLQGLADKATSAEEATMASLERVLYAQMLVLFAPAATPAASHLPLLLETLRSRQPALRRAAADTLRHLAERDPEAMLPARVEATLLAALDGEPDASVAAQLQATLRTLLAAGAPTRPAHYLAVCTTVIFSAAPPPAAAQQPGATEPDEEDSDADEASEARVPAASPEPPQQQKPAGGTRLRTREFAAKCLLALPGLVADDKRHLDPTLAKGTQGDWLIAHLQALIDAAFNMATGGAEALRPHGLKLLRVILRHFGETPDPLLEGGRLLEQSQAQFVSALRSALRREAAPKLLAAGALLAADFVESGLAQGDAVLLARLIGMMTDPLAAMLTHPQEQYAEWVEARARTALLEAHATCAVHLLSSPQPGARKVLADAQRAHPGMLMRQWLALLQDWLVLAYESEAVRSTYTPRLAAAASPQAVLPFLRQAWQPVLGAACRLLEHAGQGEEAREPPVDADGYRLLMDACLAVVCNASEPKAVPRVAEGDLALALTGLRSLFTTHFLAEAWCGRSLCREVVVAVGGLIKQASLSGEALAAAGAVIRQVCAAAPPEYLAVGLAGALAATILAGIEASGVLTPAGAESEAAACSILDAGALLLGRAKDGAALQPRLLIKAASLLKLSEQGKVLEGASACLLSAAEAAASRLQTLDPATMETAESKQNSSGDEPPADADLLAYTAAAASTALTLSLPQQAPEAELTRFGVLLPLVLAVGGLLPEPKGSQTPQLQPLELSNSQEATERLEARQPSPPAGDDWAEDGFQNADSAPGGWADDGLQNADSASGGWADDGFQTATAVSEPDGGGEDSEGSWGADFEAASPTSPVDEAESRAGGMVASGADEPEGEAPHELPAAAPLDSAASQQLPADTGGPLVTNSSGALEEATAALAAESSDSTRHTAEWQGEEREQLQPDASPAEEDEWAFEEASPQGEEPSAEAQQASDAAEARGVDSGQMEESSPLPALSGSGAETAQPSDAPAVPKEAAPEGSDDGFAASEAARSGVSQQPPQEEQQVVADGDESAVPAEAQSPMTEPADAAPVPLSQGERRVSEDRGSNESAAQAKAQVSEPADAASEPPQEADDWGSDDDFADFEAAAGSPSEAAEPSQESPLSRSADAGDSPKRQILNGQELPAAEEPVSADAPVPAAMEPLQSESPEAAAAVAKQSEEPVGPVPEVLMTARTACLQALAGLLDPRVPLLAQAKALTAVRSLAQEAAARGKCSWAAACAATLANPAAHNLQELTQESSDGGLSQEQILVASETLKLLHSSLALLAREGPDAESRCLGLLVQLLVVCAAPRGGGSAAGLLRELVAKLMTVLAGGTSATAFRSALLALPAHSREKLQLAWETEDLPKTARTATATGFDCV